MITLVPAVAITLDVFSAHAGGALFLDTQLVVMAVTLMILAVAVLIEQYCSVHKLRLLQGYAKPGSNRLMDAISAKLCSTDAECLQFRLKFLLERFRAPQAVRYYFILQARQLLLTIIAFSGNFFPDPAGAYFQAIVSCIVFISRIFLLKK